MRDVKLKGITWDHVRGYGPLMASTNPYQDERGVSVIWEKRSLKDFGDASLETLASLYDLIIMDHPHVGIASKTRAVIPLDEVLPKETLADAYLNAAGPSFKSYYYNDHLWALPIDAACQMASFRDDMIAADSLPQTWDEVYALAHDLRDRDKFIGIAMCPTDCNCSFLTLCAQHGDPFEDNKFISDATGLWALDILRKLFAISHPASALWNPIRLYDYMASEEDVVYCPLAFGYSNYSRADFARNKLRFGPVPGKRMALLGGAGIAISQHCQAINEASAYVSWICSEHLQSTVYVANGGQPAHRKAWLNQYANDISGDFFISTLSTLDAAYIRPRNSSWPMFQEECGDVIFSFLTQKKETSFAWNELKQCYRKHFE